MLKRKGIHGDEIIVLSFAELKTKKFTHAQIRQSSQFLAIRNCVFLRHGNRQKIGRGKAKRWPFVLCFYPQIRRRVGSFHCFGFILFVLSRNVPKHRQRAKERTRRTYIWWRARDSDHDCMIFFNAIVNAEFLDWTVDDCRITNLAHFLL